MLQCLGRWRRGREEGREVRWWEQHTSVTRVVGSATGHYCGNAGNGVKHKLISGPAWACTNHYYGLYQSASTTSHPYQPITCNNQLPVPTNYLYQPFICTNLHSFWLPHREASLGVWYTTLTHIPTIASASAQPGASAQSGASVCPVSVCVWLGH